jgi:hypothetical protein
MLIKRDINVTIKLTLQPLLSVFVTGAVKLVTTLILEMSIGDCELFAQALHPGT